MPEHLIPELREKFAIENIVGFDLGSGRLPRVVVTSGPAEAHIYLHGAHITHYRHRGGAPELFLSAQSCFESDKPIRGGVPICWPWFGPNKQNPAAPIHGFARLSNWTVENVRQISTGELEISLTLTPDPQWQSFWPHAFLLRYTITVGQSLDLALTVTNTGDQPFTYEEALHTYFAVSDIRQVQLLGLAGASYTSKVPPGGAFTQSADPIRFAGETDSVYTNTTADCTILDPTKDRTVLVHKEGSHSTVVWNPWIDKAKAMPDFGNDEWTKMLCVETANVHANAIALPPGHSHLMRQRIIEQNP